MQIIEREKYIELIADEGKILHNNEDIYAYNVMLGNLDKPENWKEVEDVDR